MTSTGKRSKAPRRFSVKEKALSSQELDAIIRSCSEAGVIKLKFGDLHISFGKKVREELVATIPPKTFEPEISEEQHKAQTKNTVERNEIEMREEQVAFSIIEDPALAEKLISEGELPDDDGNWDNGPNGESASL